MQLRRPPAVLLGARFQVHPAFFAPIAESQPMPRGRPEPNAMQHDPRTQYQEKREIARTRFRSQVRSA
jgi:hypothetical protein